MRFDNRASHHLERLYSRDWDVSYTGYPLPLPHEDWYRVGTPQSTVILDIKKADFALFLHPGVLFVVPKEEHLMMVLFSSYG